MKKAIITVLGDDRVGIIARVCAALAERNVNILDISQTITHGFFNMVMVADVSACTVSFDALGGELEDIGRQMGLRIQTQSEDIFRMMHRI